MQENKMGDVYEHSVRNEYFYHYCYSRNFEFKH